ncbi:hypothetical protein niasHT_033781 [Heterodera trifolii]|uniref:Uncharacterized protein n=1 Tax=Heterodera trifolii TaxID=157864 RepID=A0ABD2J7B2_9BILA
MREKGMLRRDITVRENNGKISTRDSFLGLRAAAAYCAPNFLPIAYGGFVLLFDGLCHARPNLYGEWSPFHSAPRCRCDFERLSGAHFGVWSWHCWSVGGSKPPCGVHFSSCARLNGASWSTTTKEWCEKKRRIKI